MRFRLGTALSILDDLSSPGEEEHTIEIISREEYLQKSREKQLPGYFSRMILDAQCTRAELLNGCIAGAFLIPQKENLLGQFRSFGYYISHSDILFVDDSGMTVELLKTLMNFYTAPAPSTGHFFFAFLEAMIEEDWGCLQAFEEQLTEIEEEIMENPLPGINKKILNMRKGFMRLTAYYDQLEDMGELLQENESGLFATEELRRFKLFTNRVSHLASSTEMLREYSMQVREMYQSQIDIRQNVIMKVLTVVTTIFMPLTLIAGWYGMNFINMPELHWRYGYAVIIGVSALVILLEIWIFKRKKFL